MTFPIVAVPDPEDDGFEEPVCEECEDTGEMTIWDQGEFVDYAPCTKHHPEEEE